MVKAKKIDLSFSIVGNICVLFFLFVAWIISLSSKIDIFLGNQEHPNDLLVVRSADCNDRRHPLHLLYVQSPVPGLLCPRVSIKFDVSFLVSYIILYLL